MCSITKEGYANNEHGIEVSINTATSNESYTCISCGAAIGVKTPTFKSKHFFHINYQTNGNHTNETELHYECKMSILEELRKDFPNGNWEEERYIKKIKARPDISGRINGIPVAIEIQHTAITPKEINQRTAKFTSMGISTLWIVPYTGTVKGINRLKTYELYLHALYKGTLYSWNKNVGIIPLHFQWESKTKRNVIPGESLSFKDSFKVMKASNSFTYKGIKFPNLLLGTMQKVSWPMKDIPYQTRKQRKQVIYTQEKSMFNINTYAWIVGLGLAIAYIMN